MRKRNSKHLTNGLQGQYPLQGVYLEHVFLSQLMLAISFTESRPILLGHISLIVNHIT